MSENQFQSTLWNTVKGGLQTAIPQDIFRAWFDPIICLSEEDEEVVLAVPSDFAAIWVQDNYADLIRTRMQEAAGRSLGLRITVDPAADEPKPSQPGNNRIETSEPAKDRTETTTTPREAEQSKVVDATRTPWGDRLILNPRNNFENFVVGPGNQLAHAACIAVANAPAEAYNPLFLYGETGLGKTHLMHAVAHHILRTRPKARVVYVSTEKFTNEFIRAITENTVPKFRQRYRNVDVLLIDDIHFLSNKERIQEEFFHTFNDLFESQKQIFLSSDRPASEIAKLESRLISRFQWGLVTDIQPPDLETRVAILGKKAANMRLELPENILQFLAERVSRNVRRMEGALTRVAGYRSLANRNPDTETLERLLQDILQEEAQNVVTVEKIQQKVADHYNLRLGDMVSKRRPAKIAFPRQVAMYLSRMLTSHSLQEIGDTFGGRDHGTVIHACKTVENMMEQDESVRRAVEYLQKHLSS